MSTMTLEQVRDWLRNESRLVMEEDGLFHESQHRKAMADAIDAELAKQAAQPAEQARGEPLALGYVPGELDRTAPEVIYLQIDTDGDNNDRDEPWTGDMDYNVSWCAESMGGLEIQYVRGDLIDQPKPEQSNYPEFPDSSKPQQASHIAHERKLVEPEQAVGDGVGQQSIIGVVLQSVFDAVHRFEECCEDGEDVDLSRDWLDALTTIGALERVQKSPARWGLTKAGSDMLYAHPAVCKSVLTPGPVTEDELKRAWNMIGQAHPEKEWVKRALTAFLELRLASQEAAIATPRPAVATAGVPEGWKLVPVVPDEAMTRSGAKFVHDKGDSGMSAHKFYAGIYSSMLATAPGVPNA